MRSFLSGASRRPRRTDRFQSRFSRGRTGEGGRLLIRFRRNRELMAREITGFVLWCAIGLALVSLGKTLVKVGNVHFAGEHTLVRFALPLLAVVALVGAAFKARKSFREFLDIRREQAELTARLQAGQEPEDES